MKILSLVVVCAILAGSAEAQCYGPRCFGDGFYRWAPRVYAPRNFSGYYPAPRYTPYWRYSTPWYPR